MILQLSGHEGRAVEIAVVVKPRLAVLALALPAAWWLGDTGVERALLWGSVVLVFVALQLLRLLTAIGEPAISETAKTIMIVAGSASVGGVNFTVGTDGSIYVWDDFADLTHKPPQAFYRLRYVP